MRQRFCGLALLLFALGACKPSVSAVVLPSKSYEQELARVLGELKSTPATQSDPNQPIQIDGVRFDPDFSNNGQMSVRFSLLEQGVNLTEQLRPEAVALVLRPYRVPGPAPTPTPVPFSLPNLAQLGAQLGLPTSIDLQASGSASLPGADLSASLGANITLPGLGLPGGVGSSVPPTPSATGASDQDIPASWHVRLPEAVPPLHLGVAIDASGSMQRNDPDRLRVKALKALVALLRPEDQVAVTYFGLKQQRKQDSMLKVAAAFGASRAAVNQAIDAVPAEGATPLFDGAYQVVDQVAKLDGAKARAVLVLTDGTDNASTRKLADVAARARERDVFFVMVAFADIHEQVLQALVGQTGGLFLGQPTGAHLDGLISAAGRAIMGRSATLDVVVPAQHRQELTYAGTIQTVLTGGRSLSGGFQITRPSSP